MCSFFCTKSWLGSGCRRLTGVSKIVSSNFLVCTALMITANVYSYARNDNYDNICGVLWVLFWITDWAFFLIIIICTQGALIVITLVHSAVLPLQSWTGYGLVLVTGEGVELGSLLYRLLYNVHSQLCVCFISYYNYLP